MIKIDWLILMIKNSFGQMVFYTPENRISSFSFFFNCFNSTNTCGSNNQFFIHIHMVLQSILKLANQSTKFLFVCLFFLTIGQLVFHLTFDLAVVMYCQWTTTTTTTSMVIDRKCLSIFVFQSLFQHLACHHYNHSGKQRKKTRSIVHKKNQFFFCWIWILVFFFFFDSFIYSTSD